jgi:pantetheine-phosphate adenylyltransferase
MTPTISAGEPVIAVYPGTFDPITNGHLDILERALALFDKLVITIAVNQRKVPLFTVEDRIGFIRDALPQYGERIAFAANDGLLVDFCKSQGARVIVRGLRALADFEYEFQFSHMNRRLAPEIDTVFFMTDERNHYVSSSLVKEVASLGGDITGLVPPPVQRALALKYGKQP